MGSGDYVRFLTIARGSLHETETLLLLSADLNFLEPRELATAMARIRCSKMLAMMIRKLGRKKSPKGLGFPPTSSFHLPAINWSAE